MRRRPVSESTPAVDAWPLARDGDEARGPGWRVIEDGSGGEDDFAAAVAEGLTAEPKRLACRHLYDAEGSALFEAICRQPEYYLPAAETEILRARAPAIVAALAPGSALLELGSGSAEKTRILLRALLAREGGARYLPVDISAAALVASARALAREHEGLEVIGVRGDWERGLARAAAQHDGPRAVLWLGSSIGNLARVEAAAFLDRTRRRLGAGDRLLVGFDLRKDRRTLERAYDDRAGVTARFNLNLLARVNRELGGRFDLEAFAHRASWDEAGGRMQMHLVSRRPQRVRVDGLALEARFVGGEAIHTEDAHKYDLAEIDALAAAAGLALVDRWLDARARFALCLLAVRPRGAIV